MKVFVLFDIENSCLGNMVFGLDTPLRSTGQETFSQLSTPRQVRVKRVFIK